MQPTFKQLDLTVNVGPLQRELAGNDELFGQYPMRGEFPGSPHEEMKDIWIRYNDVKPFLKSGDWSTFADEHDSIWYPSANKIPSAKRIALKIMAEEEGERLGGILITKLPPYGKIKKHTDSGWHASYYDKYYVAVDSPKGSIFGFDQGEISAQNGDIFWFDNSHPHWVENNTAYDRISMIVCIRTNKHRRHS